MIEFFTNENLTKISTAWQLKFLYIIYGINFENVLPPGLEKLITINIFVNSCPILSFDKPECFGR